MKIWLDDIRPAPAGWVHLKSVREFIAVMGDSLDRGCEPFVKEVSFDHDAGDYFYEGGDYIDALNWLEDTIAFRMENHLPYYIPFMSVHSMNPVGRERMENIISKIQSWG